jgi:hypothetical protein
MDPFAAALDSIRALSSVTVEIRRGNQSTLVQATIGSTMFRVDTDEQANVVIRSVDFMIKAADYKFGGVKTKPRQSDGVVLTLAGERQTHELLRYGGEPEWRWADPHAQTEYRCHTKLVGTA